jgi:uncharacterized membrane protein YhhN
MSTTNRAGLAIILINIWIRPTDPSAVLIGFIACLVGGALLVIPKRSAHGHE